MKDYLSRWASPEPADCNARDEVRAARDLMQAGYRPTSQRGHIERPHGAATITNERVWSAMREALARG